MTELKQLYKEKGNIERVLILKLFMMKLKNYLVR